MPARGLGSLRSAGMEGRWWREQGLVRTGENGMEGEMEVRNRERESQGEGGGGGGREGGSEGKDREGDGERERGVGQGIGSERERGEGARAANKVCESPQRRERYRLINRDKH